MATSLHSRNYALDIARIIAIFAVVFIHCSAPFVTDYPKFSTEFVVGNIFDSIARLAVPLFVMISGALFLDENKSITLKSILCKNIKNIAIITIVWSMIYSVTNNAILPVINGQGISIKEIIYDIINSHSNMWYLFMIMGLYMITPFLKKFVCKENHKLVLAFIAIALCFHFVKPIINMTCVLGIDISFASKWLDKFDLGFFGGYVTYYLAGWYIVHIGIKKTLTRIIYLLGALSLVAMFAYVQITGDYNNGYQNLGLPVFIYSIGAFIALNNLKLNLNPDTKAARILTTLSKLTFGVYLIHTIVLTVFSRLIPYSQNSLVYILISFTVVTCVSFVVSFVISKTPLLKKLIKF